MAVPVPARFPGIARRAGWNVVDQMLSALSNVLLSVIVARTVDADGFGAFSIAFLVFSLLVAVNRAIVGEPLKITFSTAAPGNFRLAVRSALGAALLIATGAGLVCAVTGLGVGGQTGHALVALAICLPGLLLQDTCRMAFFSSGRADRAAFNDGLWTIVELVALVVVLASGIDDVRVPIAVWGGSAALAAFVGFRALDCAPRPRGSARWVVDQRRLTGYLLAEYILGQGSAQIGILLVGVLGTPAGVGSLRAAQLLLGPVNILGAAAFMFAVPEIARRPLMKLRDRQRFTLGVSGAMGLATAVYAGAILVIPESAGTALFGDTWIGAERVLLPMCVLSFAAALATGPAASLYGMGMARTTFSINVIKAPLLTVLMLGGIQVWGAVGAAWAIAVTEAALLPLWFVRVRRAIRHHPSGLDAAAVTTSDKPGTSTADRMS